MSDMYMGDSPWAVNIDDNLRTWISDLSVELWNKKLKAGRAKTSKQTVIAKNHQQ
jgi:hypothetical protein